jgi:hypothetical protein
LVQTTSITLKSTKTKKVPPKESHYPSLGAGSALLYLF